MELSTQKWLRFIIPGVMLYGLAILFCWTTGWCEISRPATFEEISKLLLAIVLGFIYSLTRLRKFSNSGYHSSVNVNITNHLVQPFLGQYPKMRELSWNKVRHVFYKIVDSDETLKTKSQIIRWNGLLWTSIADLRVVVAFGILALFFSIFAHRVSDGWVVDNQRIGFVLFVLFSLFALSFWISSILTKRHRVLGEEQCEFIIMHHKTDLESSLKQAAGC